MPQRDVIVVATSAGGVEALKELAAGLPADLPAAVLVVIHVPPQSPGLVPQILNRAGALPAAHGTDGEELRRGRIYVAPADAHMTVEGDHIRLLRGPRENLHRPAADPLFRSAAVSHGRRVIGVVLTGALDDGTAGLGAIKRRGGIAVVQEPADASYPSMPESALRNVEVDHCLPLAEIPSLLDRLARESVAALPEEEAPVEMKMEVGMAGMASDEDKMDRVGTRTTFTCPECHGTLWEMNEQGALRFRCHVGHAYGAETLLSLQENGLEEALWAAVRAFEENAKLSERMAARSRAQGNGTVEERFLHRVSTARQHAAQVRGLLEKIEVAAPTSA